MKYCNTEIWLNVKGYEGLYMVSNMGCVKSLDRKITNSNGIEVNLKGKVIKPKISKGYQQVNLHVDGKSKLISLARLVAQHFVENPEKKPQVNHIDENKLNNKYSNLEWVTAKENANHGTRNSRISDYVTKNGAIINRQSINNRKKVAMLNPDTKEVLNIFDSIIEAKLYMGSKSRSGNISSVCAGNRRTAFGYAWKFI